MFEWTAKAKAAEPSLLLRVPDRANEEDGATQALPDRNQERAVYLERQRCRRRAYPRRGDCRRLRADFIHLHKRLLLHKRDVSVNRSQLREVSAHGIKSIEHTERHERLVERLLVFEREARQLHKSLRDGPQVSHPAVPGEHVNG